MPRDGVQGTGVLSAARTGSDVVSVISSTGLLAWFYIDNPNSPPRLSSAQAILGRDLKRERTAQEKREKLIEDEEKKKIYCCTTDTVMIWVYCNSQTSGLNTLRLEVERCIFVSCQP